MASAMENLECCLKTQPSPRTQASYVKRVKHLLGNIPSTPSTVRGGVSGDDEKLGDSSSSIASTRTASELPSETSTAATSVESLALVFMVQKFHVSPNMPIDDKIKTIWTRQIKSRLTAILLHSIPAGTCIQEFMMVGKKPNAMKPTLIITCGDAETKKRVEKAFKSQAWLQELLKANGIRFITLVAKATFSAGPALDSPDTLRLGERCAVLLDDSLGSPCGHLLLIGGPHVQTQRHCTLGGLIIVKGKVHGLTAKHPFESFGDHVSAQQEYDDAQDANLSEDEDSSEASSEPFIFNDDDSSDDDDLSSTSTNSSQSHASACSTPASSLSHWQNANSTYHTPSVTPSPPLDVIIPQPSSESPGEPRGECDWALLDILPRSMRVMHNRVPRTDILIERTVSGHLDGRVIVVGAELKSGYLHPSPVTMIVDKSILHVRLITLDRVLPLGTSGAWVILGEELCGFIIAIRQDVPWAYMMPIEPVMEDIRRRFGTTDVRLPRRGEVESSTISESSDEPQEKSVAAQSMSNNRSEISVEQSKQPLEGPQEEMLNERPFIPERKAGEETHVQPPPLSESSGSNHEPVGLPTGVESSLFSAVDSTLPTADAPSERTFLGIISALLLLIGYGVRSMLSSTYQNLYDIWCWSGKHILRRIIHGFLSGFYYVCWVFTALYSSLLQISSDFFPSFPGRTGPRNIAPDQEMPGSRQIEPGEMVERQGAMRLVFNRMAENREDVERGTQIVIQNVGNVERSTQ